MLSGLRPSPASSCLGSAVGTPGDHHDHGHDEGGHDGDGGGDALQFPRLAHLVVIDRVAIILREYVRR